MASVRCEVCGDKVPGATPAGGVICDVCFVTRRVVLADEALDEPLTIAEANASRDEPPVAAAAAASEPRLELLPERVGPGEARIPAPAPPADELLPPDSREGDAAPVFRSLRPSDEGKIDLDPSALRRKTEDLRRKRESPRPPGAAPLRAPEPSAPARVEGDSPPHPRQTEAKARAAERERAALRRTLGSLLIGSLPILPVLVFLILLGLDEGGVALAHRGRVGRGLYALGRVADSGVRSLNALLPEPLRVPGVQEERTE